jgi:hypothetical protein
MSFVPELQLGLSILWSGQVDEFSWSQQAYDVLIPGFVNGLTPLQPFPVTNPPNPSSYLGKYTCNFIIIMGLTLYKMRAKLSL